MNSYYRALVAATVILAVPMAAGAQLVIGGISSPMLKAGTQVELKLVSELTTNGKRLRVGDRFNLEVSEPVQLNGRVVIPAGSIAVGEITSVRNKGMWGKSGNIEGRVLYVRVNGQQIRLSGALHDKGVTGTGAVVGSVALLPIAGFFMTGTSAKLPAGSTVKAYLDEDLPVVFADGGTPAASPRIIPTSTGAAASQMSNGEATGIFADPR